MDKGKFFPLYLLLFALLWLINCEDNPSSSNNEDGPPFQTSIVSGQVILENQDEHSNCAIFDSALTMLTGSDSSGNYSLDFKDEYPDFTGKIKLIYYLFDYAPDTAEVLLISGFLQKDTLSVNESGEIDHLKIKQLIELRGWSSDSIAVVGDSLTFTAIFTNVSETEIVIKLYSIEDDLSWVSLIQGPFNHFYPLTNTWLTTSEVDRTITLLPAAYYEGARTAKVLGKIINGVFHTIPAGAYVITTFFYYGNRSLSSENQIRGFLNRYWEYHHRGKNPTCPLPQKFYLPRIEIVNAE